MAQHPIGIGAAEDDGTGDPIRTAFDKLNTDLTEVFGSLGQRFDTGAHMLLGTPAYIGQRMASADGWFGLGFGVAPGQVTPWFVSQGGKAEPVFVWDGTNVIVAGANVSLVVNEGKLHGNKGITAGSYTTDYGFIFTGSFAGNGVGTIRHLDPTGFSGFDCLETSEAGGFTVCFNNEGTTGEQEPRTCNLLSFFGVTGSATGAAAPILIGLYGDYGSGAHLYRSIRIDTNGTIKFFKFLAGSPVETAGTSMELHPTGKVTIGTSTPLGDALLTVDGGIAVDSFSGDGVDTDATLAADSDSKIASQKSVRKFAQDTATATSAAAVAAAAASYATAAQGAKADTALQPAGSGSALTGITVAQVEAASSITPVADGTYTMGALAPITSAGTITVVKGIITAVTESF